MRPELPFLAAGAVALVGGVRASGGFPADGARAVVATVVLVLVASATGNTKLAPLVNALGIALLIAATFGTVRKFQVPPAPAGTPAKVK